MKYGALVVLLAMAIVFAGPCMGYDTETHALITRKAYSNSVLANRSGFPAVGLDRLDIQNPFNLYWQAQNIPQYYTDGFGNPQTIYQHPEAFERCQMQEFLYLPSDSAYNEYRLFADTVSTNTGASYFQDTLLPIQNWLVRGAIREDDLGSAASGNAPSISHCGAELLDSVQGNSPRSLNHFYDPYFDSALFPCPPNLSTAGFCYKAVDWALGYVDSFAAITQIDPNRSNFYSYADARNTFWWALTQERNNHPGQSYTSIGRQLDSMDRLRLWATTLRSLGDVVHLLEDMSQPQHTRNDAHGGPFVSSGERLAFEDYTNDRILGVTDESNAYVLGFFGGLRTRFTAPPLGNYPGPGVPPVMFATPARFFTTRADGGGQLTRAGLADYTNRGFFTGGSLPGRTSDPLPPPLSDPSYTVTPRMPCEGLLDADSRVKSATCKHYTRLVPDVVSPNYVDNLPNGFTQPPLASESIFRQVITTVGGQQVVNYVPDTVLSIAELDTTGNMTIPRAVGYATGMINFFFRGSLQVTAPSDGMYAIVNHGMSHTVDADGYPICSQTVASPADNTKNLCTAGGIFGFTSVRLNVQNTTPAATESGTNLPISKATGGTNAKMVAVARYHRNPCYQPDLAGEPSADSTGAPRTPINCSAPRTAYQEISVSADVLIAPGILDGQNPLEQVFDFSNDPIPINATDLFIQVAYRGPLGAETDGIAVGMVDISEPTYLSLFNSTDYEWKDNTWQIPTGSDSPPVPFTSIQICSGPWQIYDLSNSSWQQLPVTHALRLAALRDFSNQPYKMSIASAQGNYAVGGQATTWQGRQRQALDEKGTGYYYDQMFYGRGMVVSDYTQSPHVIVGTTLPTDAQSLTYWDKPVLQPDVSENVGTITQPGTKACTF